MTRHNTAAKTRSAATVAAAALVGAAIGVGGGSLALWHDAAQASGSISSGYESFAAGIVDPSDTPTDNPDLTSASAANHDVIVSIGADEAQTLVDDGRIAIPFRTDSLSQGNKGLHYSIDEPDWGNGVFGHSDVSVYWVDSPSACTTGPISKAAPIIADHVDEDHLTSTPVSAEYSTGTTPVTEYWCLTAMLNPDDEGTYTNTATAEGTAPDNNTVTDTDSWEANITTSLDPSNESEHDITFSYQTFRPGSEPTP